MSPGSRQYLYRFHAADGQLLYVGITQDPRARFLAHQADKPWWPEVHRITMELYPSRRAVELAERVAIRDEHPAHNVAMVAPGIRRPPVLPRGVEQLPSGAYRGRFNYRGRTYRATWDTPAQAAAWIQRTRRALAIYAPAAPAQILAGDRG